VCLYIYHIQVYINLNLCPPADVNLEDDVYFANNEGGFYMDMDTDVLDSSYTSDNDNGTYVLCCIYLMFVCLLIHSQSAISKAGKRKLEGCTQEGNKNKKIRSDMVNKDDTELDASAPNAAVNDVVVERAKDDVCVDSKVETTRLSPNVSDIGKDNNDDGK